MSLTTLEALRLSTLAQLKAVEATGQSHSLGGRQTALADYDKLVNKLADIESAITFKGQAANRGNNGYATRIASFGEC